MQTFMSLKNQLWPFFIGCFPNYIKKWGGAQWLKVIKCRLLRPSSGQNMMKRPLGGCSAPFLSTAALKREKKSEQLWASAGKACQKRFENPSFRNSTRSNDFIMLHHGSPSTCFIYHTELWATEEAIYVKIFSGVEQPTSIAILSVWLIKRELRVMQIIVHKPSNISMYNIYRMKSFK